MTAEDPPTPGASERVARLSDADAEAIDRLFEGGLGDSETSDPREAAALELLSVLDSYPVEPATDELVDATLARVARDEAGRSARLSIGDAPVFSGRRVRVPDFFAVAAALFLAFGIGWPLYQMIERQNDALHSRVRLNEYGAGIVSFASDHDDALPLHEGMITESGHSMSELPCALEGRWGTQLHRALTDSNPSRPSRHLSDQFDRAERIRLEKIGPMSYRVPVSVATFNLSGYAPSEPLLADPNPVIWSKRGQRPTLSPRQGSHVHGQPMVVLLRFDLSIETLPSAVLPDGDSLWVHDGYEDSTNERIRPRSLDDAVLAH